eukprot:c15245_g3_i1 orf=329-673(+)
MVYHIFGKIGMAGCCYFLSHTTLLYACIYLLLRFIATLAPRLGFTQSQQPAGVRATEGFLISANGLCTSVRSLPRTFLLSALNQHNLHRHSLDDDDDLYSFGAGDLHSSSSSSS